MESAEGKGILEFGVDVAPVKISAKQRKAAGAHGDPRDYLPKRKKQSDTNTRPVWGEPEPKKKGHSYLRDQVATTVVSADLIPTSPEQKAKRPPLKPGDPFIVFPGLIDYDGVYGTEGVKPRSVIDSRENTTIVAIHRPGRGMTLELKRDDPDASLSHIFVAKIGSHWDRIKEDKK